MPDLYDGLTSMDLAVLDAWMQIDPQGEERADLRAGIVTAAIETLRTKAPQKPGDYMPIIRSLEAQRIQDTVEQAEHLKRQWGKAMRMWNRKRK